jgi:uncharacterized protein YhaN
MILKECAIDNFGKFSNKKFTFTGGLNSFDEDNGWGKTTLAAFIKALFYGMDETRSRSLFIDRERYMPWQGGTYGGMLVFSHEGTDYKVVRSFGTKKKDDTFGLYEVKTGKPSKAYTEKLGEELFTVDLETFERSVFVSLDESRKPQGSTGITAKLNDLIEDAGDIGNYDAAYGRLEKLAAGLKTKRGTGGSIANLEAVVERADAELRDIASKEKAVGIYQEKTAAEKKEVQKKEQELRKLHEQFSVSERYTRKQSYDQLKEQELAAAAKQKRILAFFHDTVPDAGTLETISHTVDEYTKYVNFLHKDPVTETDRADYQTLLSFFKGDVPSAEAVAACQRDCDSYDTLKQQMNELKLSPDEADELSVLKNKFAGKAVSGKMIDGYLSDYETVQELKNEISGIENSRMTADSELEQLKKQKPKNIKRLIFFCIAAVCAAAGGVFIIKSIPAGIAGFAVAGACVVLAVVQKTVRRSFPEQEEKIKALEDKAVQKKMEAGKLEEGYKNFITGMNCGLSASSVTVMLSDIKNDFSRYETLKNKEVAYSAWIEKQETAPAEYEKRIRTFEIKCGQKDDVTMIASILEIVRDKIAALTELKKRIEAYDDNTVKRAECEEKVKESLSLFESDRAFSYDRQVQEIRDRKHDYEVSVSDLKDVREKLAAFESQNDVTLLKDAVKPEKGPEELKAGLDAVQTEINSHLSLIADAQKNINDLLSFIDRRQELENGLERCRADKEMQEKQYEILTKTMEYLAAAKEKLDSNYMAPMKSGFEKYIRMLDETAVFEINSDLTVSVEDNGKPYDSRYLSEGYKDLVNFCSRMALVDALFKNEKPVVILDDPFVNLDEVKLARALQVIRQMAEEKQILYFVCHKSRNAAG